MFFPTNTTAPERKQMPLHKHHCAECQFLGNAVPMALEEKNSVDCYVHTGWRAGTGTFTRRWGPGPHHYAEVPIFMADGPRWEVVRQAAIKKGYLKP